MVVLIKELIDSQRSGLTAHLGSKEQLFRQFEVLGIHKVLHPPCWRHGRSLRLAREGVEQVLSGVCGLGVWVEG